MICWLVSLAAAVVDGIRDSGRQQEVVRFYSLFPGCKRSWFDNQEQERFNSIGFMPGSKFMPRSNQVLRREINVIFQPFSMRRTKCTTIYYFLSGEANAERMETRCHKKWGLQPWLISPIWTPWKNAPCALIWRGTLCSGPVVMLRAVQYALLVSRNASFAKIPSRLVPGYLVVASTWNV